MLVLVRVYNEFSLAPVGPSETMQQMALRTFLLPATLVVFALAWLLGCEHVEIETVATVPKRQETAAAPEVAEPEVTDVPATTWVTDDQLPLEEWYLQSLGGRRIGLFKTVVENRAGRLLITQDGRFEFPTNAQLPQYRVELESWENTSGQLSEFTETTIVGSETNLVQGHLPTTRGDLKLRTSTDPAMLRTARERPIAWQEGTWGVLGLQSMLRHHPMQPGERCTCRIFIPKLGKIVPVQLQAGEAELTALPGGETPELVPIEVLMVDGERSLRSRNWIDAAGIIYKTVTLDGPMLSTFRAPREVALRISSEMELAEQLGKSATLVGLGPDNKARTATYEIESPEQDLYLLWDQKVRQSVTSLSPFSVQVVIHDALDSDASTAQDADLPTPAATASSTILCADDPRIVEFAQSLMVDAPDGSDTERALHLTQRLAAEVTYRPLTAKVAGCIETYRTLTGDSPELAILLTTLLRSQAIPARVASGLKIDAPAARLNFAMWSEAWVDGRWLPLDAVTGGVTPVSCIKIQDSTLADDNPYAIIMPVYRHIDKLKVRLKDSE